MPERTRPDREDLSGAWERNAPDWIAWARAPGHDSYWRFNRDLFLELVPGPGRRTLDLGCGEGRFSRDLKAIGHDVVGVDVSPSMVAAAREADPSIEVHCADAARLPFDDGAFDLVVAFMTLQDIESLDDAVAEAGRVLEPGGRLCLAVVHPVSSAGDFTADEAEAPFVIAGSYLAETYYVDVVERDGYRVEFASKHRPLQAYTEALAAEGFVVERVREVPYPESEITQERSRRWQRIPLFLFIRALAGSDPRVARDASRSPGRPRRTAP
jgi:SAM-dependent methyltransferase